MRCKKLINIRSVIKYYYLMHVVFNLVYFTFHYRGFSKITLHQTYMFTGLDQVFKKYEIDLLSGVILYMHSDGYADQFGGEKGKKLKIKTMKNFIMKNHQLPLDIQKEKLDKYIMDWMGKFEQVDDICVVGIKIA